MCLWWSQPQTETPAGSVWTERRSDAPYLFTHQNIALEILRRCRVRIALAMLTKAHCIHTPNVNVVLLRHLGTFFSVLKQGVAKEYAKSEVIRNFCLCEKEPYLIGVTFMGVRQRVHPIQISITVLNPTSISRVVVVPIDIEFVSNGMTHDLLSC